MFQVHCPKACLQLGRRFTRTEKGESQAACHIIITFKLQYTFTVVQGKHINLMQETQAGIEWDIFYHGLYGVGDASCSWRGGG